MKIHVLILFLVFSFQTLAKGWNEKALKMVDTYNLPVKNSIVSTVWGSIIKTRYVSKPSRKLKIEKRVVPNPYFYGEAAEYLYGDDPKLKGPKPLIIFNPGIFSPIDNGTHIIKRFCKMGYRVVSFANPLHSDFISLKPKFEIIDLKSQAIAYYHSIKIIHKHLLAKGLITDEVHLMGLSYGGLVSAIQFYLDSKEDKPIFKKGGLTAISPPFDFITSANNLNKIVESSNNDPINGKYFKTALAYWQIRRIKNESDVTQRKIEKSLALLGQYVFKNSMVKTLKMYQEKYRVNLIPKDKLEYAKWFKELNFIPVFQKIGPNIYEMLKNSNERFLYYWLELAKNMGHDNIRIISSDDDIINNGIDQRLLGSPELIQLPYGGHYGFYTSIWFDQLATFQFAK